MSATVHALPAKLSEPVQHEWRRIVRGFTVLTLVYAAVVYLIPRPALVKPEGWRLTGLFVAAIVGQMLEPIPGGAIVLLAVAIASLIGGLTIDQALAGYGDKTAWLVLCAFFISRALLKTGLARRIALFFLRLFGKSSLGVSYALAVSDCVLAGVIPSNGARAGGVIFPIARSLSEIYASEPGPTAGVFGTFIMAAIYQSACVTSAMFYTGQASNALAARMAAGFGYAVTWASWFKAAVAPGAISLLVVPWLAMRTLRPKVRRTPEASAFAARELAALGPPSRSERMVAVVFLAVCGLWMSSSWTGLDVTMIALLGIMALLLAGVLSWRDITQEHAGWAVFIWYGGLIRLGTALNDTGVPKAFAEAVARLFPGLGWVGLLALALAVYYYAHYAFASITTHMLAMFPAFLAVLAAKGAPLGLAVFAFAIFANLAASVTHYGTTPGPIIFAHGYVSRAQWWRIGFLASLVNFAIWSTVGFAWWKLIGVW
ncbi:MAG TPA: DASS family sodium-coupled anion symporter [Bryobacteraceae bacterium]|nr:DASS family sodium-coupled anion symporter [Bryobacteraceae bacterium]